MNDFHEQLIELQTRLAYQEDTIAQLNEVITRQDANISALQQQMRVIAKQLEELVAGQEYGESDVTNERPPHY